MSSVADLSEPMWEALRAVGTEPLERLWGGYWVRVSWDGERRPRTCAPVGEPYHRVCTLRALQRRGLVRFQGSDHATGSRCVLEPAGRKLLMEVENGER